MPKIPKNHPAVRIVPKLSLTATYVLQIISNCLTRIRLSSSSTASIPLVDVIVVNGRQIDFKNVIEVLHGHENYARHQLLRGNIWGLWSAILPFCMS